MFTTAIETTRRGTILADVRRRGRALALATVGVAYSALTLATQAALMAAGYDVGPDGADGKLGKNTTAAIKKYQADHGLPVTGKIDDALTSSLGKLAGAAGAAGGTAAAAAVTPAATSIASSVADSARTATYVGIGVVVVVIGVALAIARKAA
jgi:peptidoglycan hydrolase-like protein with peptidoglycan-binding domain